MRHLNTETLARILDEEAGPEERRHLETCPECAAELRALREQTDALAALPSLRPPPGDWRELEKRLVAEGLIRRTRERRAPGRGPSFRPRRGWLQAAAALVLFLGGTGVGLMASEMVGPGVPKANLSAPAGGGDAVAVRSLDDAAEALRSAEERYLDAVLRYRQLVRGTGDDGGEIADPTSRYAALETLMAASQAAVREAPEDPFLNGILASTMAEREAVLRTISSSSEQTWF